MTSYSSIVPACTNWHKGDLHYWITAVNINFWLPGIHGGSCKKRSPSGHHKKFFSSRTHIHDLIRKLSIGHLFKHAQRRAQIGCTCTPDGAYGVLWCPDHHVFVCFSAAKEALGHLERAFKLLRHQPSSGPYRDVCQSLGLAALSQDPWKAAYYFTEGHAVTFRYQALLNITRKLRWVCRLTAFFFNSSIPGQSGRHFTNDIFRCIFVNEKFCILIKISQTFVPKGSIDNVPALV